MIGARIPVKTRLRNWRLSRVPFPSIPFVDYFNEQPLLNGSVFAPELRQEQIDQIRVEVLGNGWPDAVKRWSWVWAHRHIGGSLGMGKTALLGYVTDQINKDFGSSFFHRAAPWLAIYVKVPEKIRSAAQVMAIALASIYDTNHGVSVERRLIGRLRHRVVILNAQSRYPMQLNSQPETKFANDSWLVEQGVNLDDLNKEVAGLLRREGVRAAVADAFASCTIQDYVAKFKDDRESQLFKTTHTNEAIQILLNDVAKIALAADLRRVTIILDDFYYLVRNTEPSARDSLAREWRDIVVDGNYKATRGNVFNWVAVMHSRTASTFIQAWEGVSLHSVAPMAVIQGNAVVQPGVHLRALPLRLGSQLLESYIKYSRAGRASTPIYPFAPEALNYILEFANRKGRESEGKYDPRSALEAAHEVFVRALLDRDDHNMIDLNFARHVLDGTPLQEPEQTLSIEAAEAVDELVTPPRQQRLSLNAVCGCGCHAEDGTSAHDLVALSSDGAPDTGSQSIIGYVCVACNSPASPMP